MNRNIRIIFFIVGVALLCIGAVCGYWFGRRSADNQTATPPIPVVSDKPGSGLGQQASKQGARPPVAPKNIFEVHREFAGARKNGGINRDLVARIEAYVAKTADSKDDQEIRAADVLADCYVSLNDLEEAKATFVQYLQRVEATAGREEAMKRCKAKADQLFYRDKNYPAAKMFYDLLAQRYSDLEATEYVKYMDGHYNLRTKKMPEARQAFENFIETFPQSQYAQRAKQELYTIYFNENSKDRAIDLMTRYSEQYKDADSQCYANFKIGMAHYAQGAKSYPTALKHFNLITTKYPDNRFAKQAIGMIKLINSKLTKPKPR